MKKIVLLGFLVMGLSLEVNCAKPEIKDNRFSVFSKPEAAQRYLSSAQRLGAAKGFFRGALVGGALPVVACGLPICYMLSDSQGRLIFNHYIQPDVGELALFVAAHMMLGAPVGGAIGNAVGKHLATREALARIFQKIVL